MQEKKRLRHVFLNSKTPVNWHAQHKLKKTIASVKATHYGDVYKKLNTHKGEQDIYQLAKLWHRKTKDVKFCGVNDNKGQLIVNRKQAIECWHTYFEKKFLQPSILQAACFQT